MFLDMPLESIHKFAFKAAQAASCAGEQGKYWEMHDRLFENQSALEPWTAHAEAIGLDVAKFEQCLASGKFDDEIRRDMAEARKVGVTGTPAFLVGRTEPNSSKVRVLAVLKGAKAFADFKAELDRLLEEAAKPAADSAPEPGASAEAESLTPPGGGSPPVAPVDPSPSSPALTNLSSDGKLDVTTLATLDRILRTAPSESPAWIAAPRSDPRALALADELSEAFSRAGWRVRPVRRTQLRFRPGIYLFAGEEDPPAYVVTVRLALDEAGFSPTYGTAYRSFYDEKKKNDPSWEGFPFVPEQTFLLVIGRVE